mmetsp:Transcript_153899/g.271723  ORF Transcript_153899/g.271723 Transcript_153899/m.271723 type:complete len:285 (-) Transcript_153899:16-870(-)
MDLQLAPLDTLLKETADRAATEASANMEVAMCEAVKSLREALCALREEVRAEVKQVADATTRLDSTCAKSDQLQDLKTQMGELKKEVQDSRGQLTPIIGGQEEELKKGLIDPQEQLASNVNAQQESIKAAVVPQKIEQYMKNDEVGRLRTVSTAASLTSQLEKQSTRSRSESLSQDKWECLKDQLKIQRVSMNNLFKDIEELKEYVDNKTSDLHALMSVLQTEWKSEQPPETSTMLQEMPPETSECTLPTDGDLFNKLESVRKEMASLRENSRSPSNLKVVVYV